MTTQPPLPAHADFRFLDRLRVRWAEVDMQKIVFNGHYLMYFDTAVAGYWRALAMPYHETMEALAGDLFVRKATVEYEGSARYDDQCEVGVRCARIGRSSMVFAVALFRDETRLVSGELVYVFADPATQTSRPVPPALREVLEGFEAGQPMVEYESGSWAELGREAAALRHEVFEVELGVPAGAGTPAVSAASGGGEGSDTTGGDSADTEALHVVARNRFGLVAGTARLVRESAGRARIGRVATHAALRGAGIGTALVRTLCEAARARGEREIVLAAQTGAQRFYERLGFAPSGERFTEGGRAHQEMLLRL